MSDSSQHLPYYRDVLGQDPIKERLQDYVATGASPHALLFVSEDGGEALPLAFAFARHLLCNSSVHGEACGQCKSCRQFDLLEHPDLFLVFPIVKEGSQDPISDDYLQRFKAFLSKNVRPTMALWQAEQNAGNKQLQIFVSEAAHLIQVTSLRSFSSPYQVVIVWQPEKLRVETANKLLKLLEEPPEGVKFLFVSHEPQKLLPTIISRLQRLQLFAVPDELLVGCLQGMYQTDEAHLREVVHLSNGNLSRAVQLLGKREEKGIDYFGEALDLLLLPMDRKPKPFKREAERIAQYSRPDVLLILDRVPEVLREALAWKYGTSSVVYVPEQHQSKVALLAEVVSLSSVEQVKRDFDAARDEVRQNANIKIVFFDLLLNLAMVYARA